MSPQSLVARLKQVWPDVKLKSYKTYGRDALEVITEDGLHFYFKVNGRDWILASRL